MKHAPNIDMVAPLDVEDQMRILTQRPETQPWKVQFMSASGEAGTWMTADMAVCPLQFINEAKRSFGSIFA